MRHLFPIALLLATGCFDFNGAPNGGPGEPCWPEGEELCDSGLTCAPDGICRKIPPDDRATCTLSSDCPQAEACDGGRCNAYVANCGADADCRGDYYCDGQRCMKRLSSLTACARNSQCVSDACSDGICCDRACEGTCESCLMSENATADGVCAFVAADTDPADECHAELSCNGSGACAFKTLGAPCVDSEECQSSFCADGVCCNSGCAGECQSCNSSGQCVSVVNAEDAGSCDDTEHSGNCAQAPCACDSLGDCKSGGGVACANSTNCASGQTCVDGVCCSTPCVGLCEACVASKTGAASGTCAPVRDATDPDSECPGTPTCDGARACHADPNGTFCTRDYQCASGYCVIYQKGTCTGNTCRVDFGVCCNAACTGDCETCGVPTTGGTCGPKATNANCGTQRVCTADGRCLGQPGASCVSNSQCLSGQCNIQHVCQ